MLFTCGRNIKTHKGAMCCLDSIQWLCVPGVQALCMASMVCSCSAQNCICLIAMHPYCRPPDCTSACHLPTTDQGHSYCIPDCEFGAHTPRLCRVVHPHPQFTRTQ